MCVVVAHETPPGAIGGPAAMLVGAVARMGARSIDPRVLCDSCEAEAAVAGSLSGLARPLCVSCLLLNSSGGLKGRTMSTGINAAIATTAQEMIKRPYVGWNGRSLMPSVLRIKFPLDPHTAPVTSDAVSEEQNSA